MPANGSDRPPRKRTVLSAPAILTSAIAMADRSGLEALTMRDVATDLDCGAMSLYRYFATKDELLDAMLENVVAQIDHPATDRDWQDAIRASLLSAHQALVDHAWATKLWTSRAPGPARLDLMNALLRCLSQAGFSAELVYHGYHALTMHIVGFTLQEASFDQRGVDLSEIAAGFDKAFPDGRYPYLRIHLQAHINSSDLEDEFSFVLNLILGALERSRLDQPATGL